MLNISSLVVALITWIVSLLIEIAITYLGKHFFQQKYNPLEIMKWKKTIVIATLCAITSFVISMIIEINDRTENIRRMTEEIMKSNSYLRAIEKKESLDPDSPLRVYLKEEFKSMEEKFRQISEFEVLLKREEVIPCWELLIENSHKCIDATNVISMDDWKIFSPNEGKEVHIKALKKGTSIRRILIYDTQDWRDRKLLVSKAMEQHSWSDNIEVRLLDNNCFFQSSFASNLLRSLGTQDFVIYDNETMLLTGSDDQRKIISGTLTHNKVRIEMAQKLFERLWEGAEEIKTSLK